MNKYGAIAHAHWQKYLPAQYSRLSDPQSFFEDKGQEIEARVEELSQAIAGDDPPGESYLAKAGRLKEAQLTAESEALKELLPVPESTS